MQELKGSVVADDYEKMLQVSDNLINKAAQVVSESDKLVKKYTNESKIIKLCDELSNKQHEIDALLVKL